MGQVRPVPSSVYWRRRLVVLGVPVLLVVLVVWLVGGRGAADEPTATGTTTVAATPTTKASTKATTKATTKASPSPTSTFTVSVADCTSLDLDVTADAKSYDAGASPKITTTITNTGSKACLVDAGSAKAAIVITSGDDRVWSSRDCASEASRNKPLLLSAGKSVSEHVTWKRVRSDQGCPATPGDARSGTYAATYSVDGVNAPPAVFTLR